MKTLVIGAGGFVGRALITRLVEEGRGPVIAAARHWQDEPPGAMAMAVGDLTDGQDRGPIFEGVDQVVHLAARVHQRREEGADPLAEYRRSNVAVTAALARSAALHGVRRFVFVSSVKVNGEGSARAYRPEDAPAPRDPYGVSKREAEEALAAIAGERGMEWVVVRPPLVYGPGVRANFLRMIRWLDRGLPLPFAAVRNRRSLVAVDNLADLLSVCLRHPAAAGRMFFAGDGEPLSTPELLVRLGAVMGRRARLLPVPVFMLRAVGLALGQSDAIDRLCGSLEVDLSANQSLLAWTPPVAVDEALSRTVQHYRREAAPR